MRAFAVEHSLVVKFDDVGQPSLCKNSCPLDQQVRIPQWHHSVEIPFSTVVPHKQIMEETAKCGITVEYRRIYLNCGKTVEKLLAYSVT